MFILTDGKSYVMENPLKQGDYISTTSPVQAKKFSYKQARALLQNKKKSIAWIKSFHMVNQDTGEVDKSAKNYKGNGGMYIGANDIQFDESIIGKIFDETKSAIGLAGWSMTQLKTYEEKLNMGLSKYDSAESDIKHALEKYKKDKGGKKPPANKIAKLGYLLDDVRDKHRNIKQCLDYIKVFEDAITYKYTIEKIKLELTKAEHREYKGRTEYYQMALELLE